MMDIWPIDEFQDIWQLASKKHDGQKYGGFEQGQQVEYINHIGSVTFEIMAASLVEKDMDVNLAIKCAMLHDTIEDTDLSFEEIKTRFGGEIAKGVLALSNNEGIVGKREKILDSLRRIKERPKEVWAVKMADRICNLYAPPFYWNIEKRESYLEESKLIYDELRSGNGYLAERLLLKIENYSKRFAL